MLGENALEVGDLIFFMNSLDQPDHVAIYCGKREGTPYIAHAVSAPYNAVMVTRLKPETIPYQVFRYREMALGLQVALRMRIWFEYQLAFSENKHDLIMDIDDLPQMAHPLTGGAAHADFAESYFPKTFYQLIGYAAHPYMPYYPYDPIVGMTCSEAVVAAFNIEQLLSANAVLSNGNLQAVWVSDALTQDAMDSYIAQLPGNKQPTAHYMQYYQSLQNGRTYTIHTNHLLREKSPSGTIPTFAAWNYAQYPDIASFIKQFPFALPLDPTISHPRALLHYAQSHPEKWHAMGAMNIVAPNGNLGPSEADKEKWRAYIAEIFESATEKHDEIMITAGLATLLNSPQRPDPVTPAKRPRRSSQGELDQTYSITDQALQDRNRSVQVLGTPERIKPPSSTHSTATEQQASPFLTHWQQRNAGRPAARILFGTEDQDDLPEDASPAKPS